MNLLNIRKIHSNGSLDNLKLRVFIRGDLQNKKLFRDTWSPTASVGTLKYVLVDVAKHKARVHQLEFFDHSCKKKLGIGYL